MVQLITVEIATNSSGAFSTTFPVNGGRLMQYRYVPDGTAPLATGADIDVVGATTGFAYINQDNIGTTAFSKLPRQATSDEAGAASLYAGSGEPVEDAAVIGGEQLTVSIAEGGDTKVGTLYLWIG